MADDAPKRSTLGKIAKWLVVATGTAIFDKTIDVIFGPTLESLKDAAFKIFSGFSLDARMLANMQPFDLQSIAIIQRILGIEPDSLIKFAGGRDHYLYPNVMHPDNQLALHTLVKFMQTFRSDFELADGGNYDAYGSFTCLGGPISNARTALFLGYEPINRDVPSLGLKRQTDCALELGIEFEVDSKELIRRGLIARPGIHNDPTPQWAIRLKDGRFLKTKEGELDYLMISRVPNWVEMQLNPDKKKPGVITIFAGCHGAAVNAVPLLLHNPKLLGQLDSLTMQHRYWQALIRIDHIDSRMHPVTHTMRHTTLSLPGNLAETAPVYVRQS